MIINLFLLYYCKLLIYSIYYFIIILKNLISEKNSMLIWCFVDYNYYVVLKFLKEYIIIMNVSDLIKSILSGFTTGMAICIPLGPSGLESIRRTVCSGFKEGFKVSLGAICADIGYLVIINLGLAKLFASNKKSEGIFWIVSGLLLLLFNEISNNCGKKAKRKSFFNINTANISGFTTGFIITFMNPMTPSLWLALSGTVLSMWKSFGNFYYFTFIISLITGMVSWFALLNFLALKGFKMLSSNASTKTSSLLKYILLILGLGFIVFGIVKFIF